MLAEDFARFETSVRGLEFIYGKKISDEALQQYWRVLKDLPFDQVNERIQSHIRYAKFFPKPVELRPKEERPKEQPKPDGAFAEGEKRAAENLEELRRFSPQTWLKIVRPKVHEVGKRKGMSFAEIEAKLQAAAECSGSLTS
jgi:hypothetical protein